MATFTTPNMVGIREDLQDVIYDISPEETPFTSAVEHVTAKSTIHEWQTDALASPTNNAAIEGANAPANSATPTVRLNNRTQIATKDARVSGTARAVDTAGRADELDYQVLKRAKEIKRDIEYTLLTNKIKVVGDGSSVAGQLAGIVSWIATNESKGAGGAAPAGNGTNVRTDGTQRALAESFVAEVCQEIFTAGGDPSVLFTGAFNRQRVSRLEVGTTGSSVAVKQQRMEDSVLRTSFNIYESDFGALKLIPNRFCRARDMLILDLNFWKIAFLPGRNMARFPLAKVGDSDAEQVLSEYTLVSANEAASGIVADLLTA